MSSEQNIISDSNINELSIKQEPVESISYDDNSLTGKALDFQYIVKPKQENFEIKTENEFNFEELQGEIFDYEAFPEFNYCNSANSKIHFCVECNDFFPYKNHHVHKEYKNIISMESNEGNSYYCEECNIIFNTPNNALGHLSLHDKIIFSCIHCSYTGKKLGELRGHLKEVHCETENRTKILSCPDCSFKTTYHLSLSRHISSKHTQVQYMCNICNRNWPDKNHVLHEKVINITRSQLSEQNPYECETCKIKLFKDEDILNHLKVHDIDYYCTHCAFRTDIRKDFLNHKANEHLDKEDTSEYVGDYAIICSKCKLFWPDKDHKTHLSMLKLTDEGVSEEKPYTCLSCRKIITNIDKAYYHLSQRCIKRRCEKCSYTASNNTLMMRHMFNKHRNPDEVVEYKYFCNLCDYKSLKLSCYNNHLNIHRDVSEKVYYDCGECNFKTADLKYIEKHRARMHGKDILSCDKCYFITKSMHSLGNHIKRNHLQEETYNCSQCSYSTHFKDNYHKHKINAHTKKLKKSSEVYVCEECAKVYTLKSTLTKHLATAHKKMGNIKRYICYECNYKSLSRSVFIQHIRKHSKDKSNIQYMYCANCDYKTGNKTNLIQHMIKHTDPSKLKMHKCSICLFETKRPHTLRAHLKTH